MTRGRGLGQADLGYGSQGSAPEAKKPFPLSMTYLTSPDDQSIRMPPPFPQFHPSPEFPT